VGISLPEKRPIELFLKMGQRAVKENAFKRALEYFEEALMLAKKLNAPSLIAKSETFIGNIKAQIDFKDKLLLKNENGTPPEPKKNRKPVSSPIYSSLTIVEVQTSNGAKWPKKEISQKETKKSKSD